MTAEEPIFETPYTSNIRVLSKTMANVESNIGINASHVLALHLFYSVLEVLLQYRFS
jgi:hypothetical protein